MSDDPVRLNIVYFAKINDVTKILASPPLSIFASISK